MERCAKQLGGLDGLALNVGISCGLSLPKMTAEAWDRDYAVNVRSHMLFAQKALEVMSPGGAIIADVLDGEPARQWPQPGL